MHGRLAQKAQRVAVSSAAAPGRSGDHAAVPIHPGLRRRSLRERQIRNFAVVLLLSQGVPMILGGDEARRTQRGNNNAYNQDELSWIDSELVADNHGLRRFWRLLIDFRKRHRSLRRTSFFDGTRNERERERDDIQWHGCLVGAPGFDDGASRVLSFTLAGFDGEEDVHVILNMDDQDLDFELPPVIGREWLRAFDTGLALPDDASEPGSEPAVRGLRFYRADARSAVVLVSAPL
jgi:isoamylase